VSIWSLILTTVIGGFGVTLLALSCGGKCVKVGLEKYRVHYHGARILIIYINKPISSICIYRSPLAICSTNMERNHLHRAGQVHIYSRSNLTSTEALR
ncbi:hypothetical protein L9F63_015110, partial [Diploptera punctata]